MVIDFLLQFVFFYLFFRVFFWFYCKITERQDRIAYQRYLELVEQKKVFPSFWG